MTLKMHFKVVLCFLVTAFSLVKVTAQTKEHQNVPDFELRLHDGTTVNLKDLKGKVLLLDFWYRGCAPCLQAIPDLIALQEEFKGDLVIIGINPYDMQEDVADYLAYKKMNYPSTFKNGDNIQKILGVKIELYPTTLLYDPQGKLVKMDSGFAKRKMNALRRAIKKALK